MIQAADQPLKGSVQLRAVAPAEIAAFRSMAEAYWQEIMPSAAVVKNEQRRDAYFQQSFGWQADHQPPYWALVDDRQVGFVHFSLTPGRATIEDFYVAPPERRQGYGSAMVQALRQIFDTYSVEVVELHVRRDSPAALAFWEAQGFRIAAYRMRQYRDPRTGQTFVGALSSDFDVAE